MPPRPVANPSRCFQPIHPGVPTLVPADRHERLRRLGRLTLKELREILRDRRTMITLVVMPLFLYPVLSVAFQQFFFAQLGNVQTPRYVVGFRNEREARYLTYVLAQGGLNVVDGSAPGSIATGIEAPFVVEGGITADLERALAEQDIDVGLSLPPDAALHFDPNRNLEVDLGLLFRDDSLTSREAAAIIERHLASANEEFLERRLANLRISQRSPPLKIEKRSLAARDAGGGTISVTALVPFVLILMTVTGAVYPAIDLTAGERERGTLEILVAAPIPRFGLLLAKYIAVLVVALLTATANLTMMTLTIETSGLGRLLFGEQGLSVGVVAAVFGLLLLFAAFFSAVLLAITSTARSFKEAQAYLIPLMLVSLAPGMLSLMPRIELRGLLLVTPLANIVLLGRDLLLMKATGAAALVVVASTLVYAGAALALAARIFGAEGVLYASQSGWADLVRRPPRPGGAVSPPAAAVATACAFGLFVLLRGLGGAGADLITRLIAGAGMTALTLGFMPLLVCVMQRVTMRDWFAAPPRLLATMAGALLVGLSFWSIEHAAVLVAARSRGVSLDALVKFLEEYVQQLQALPPGLVVALVAVVPAVFEEFFFRGFLYASVQTRWNGGVAVISTALLFGAFHLVMPNPLAIERLVSSTLMGFVLGWVRLRAGSLWPGMLLHAANNAAAILLALYGPALALRGVGVTQSEHLAPSVQAGLGLAALAGLTVIYFSTRGRNGTARPELPASPNALEA